MIGGSSGRRNFNALPITFWSNWRIWIGSAVCRERDRSGEGERDTAGQHQSQRDQVAQREKTAEVLRQWEVRMDRMRLHGEADQPCGHVRCGDIATV